MKDKTAQVRKNAIQLMKTFLLYNPFSGNLNLKAFLKKQEECEQRLSKQHVELVQNSQMSQEENQEVESLSQQQQPSLSQKMKTVEQATKDLKLRIYLRDTISFIQLIHTSLPTFFQLLGSKTATDTYKKKKKKFYIFYFKFFFFFFL